MNLPVSPDDGHAFLWALGLGAIIGVMFGGWVMSMLHKLMMTLMKMTLLGAVVVIGLALWNGYQASERTMPMPETQSSRESTKQATSTRTQQTPNNEPANRRWWEQ